MIWLPYAFFLSLSFPLDIVILYYVYSIISY